MTDLLRAEPVAEARAGSNAQPISVGDLSLALKRHVEQGFSHVRVRGEISGFKRAGSGHAYLCLKDEQAVIDGVIWRTARGAVGFIPQDGVEVIATGRLTTYPGRSRYQIVIESLELAGEGAMLALLEKRKAMLAAEGLFAAERKRPLPFIPQRIGVVTSPTGAVIRDILHRLADRFPSHVVLWPVPVQGQGAAELIAGAITGFAQMPQHERPDLLIVARGGGSIEDLWAFNEEVVLRAIAACSIPVISAVGHETDTTLCDYVADRRAPTPTAAAEMAVPVRHELLARVAQLGVRKGRCADRVRERGGERLDALARRLPRPDSLFAPQAQRVDDLAERSRRRLRARVEHASRDLLRLSGALRPGLLTQQLRGARQALEQLGRLAASLNPDNVLARGYARVTDRSGATLTSAAAAKAAGHLRLKFRDDELAVQVGTARVEPRPRRSYEPPEQTSFF